LFIIVIRTYIKFSGGMNLLPYRSEEFSTSRISHQQLSCIEPARTRYYKPFR